MTESRRVCVGTALAWLVSLREAAAARSWRDVEAVIEIMGPEIDIRLTAPPNGAEPKEGG